MSAPTKKRADGSAQRENFTPLPQSIAETTAFLSLSSYAAHLLFYFALRYRGEARNGDITIGQRKAAETLNMARSTAQKAFGELQAKGFIIAAEDTAKRSGGGLATRWRLTIFGSGSSPPSREYATWQPAKPDARPIPPRKNRTATRSTPDRHAVQPDRHAVQPDRHAVHLGRFEAENRTATRSRLYYDTHSGRGTPSEVDKGCDAGAAVLPAPGVA